MRYYFFSLTAREIRRPISNEGLGHPSAMNARHAFIQTQCVCQKHVWMEIFFLGKTSNAPLRVDSRYTARWPSRAPVVYNSTTRQSIDRRDIFLYKKTFDSSVYKKEFDSFVYKNKFDSFI
jgi:hypothetical protein